MSSETKKWGSSALRNLMYITLGAGAVLVGAFYFSKAQEKRGVEERITRIEELLDLAMKKENKQ